MDTILQQDTVAMVDMEMAGELMAILIAMDIVPHLIIEETTAGMAQEMADTIMLEQEAETVLIKLIAKPIEQELRHSLQVSLQAAIAAMKVDASGCLAQRLVEERLEIQQVQGFRLTETSGRAQTIHVLQHVLLRLAHVRLLRLQEVRE